MVSKDHKFRVGRHFRGDLVQPTQFAGEETEIEMARPRLKFRSSDSKCITIFTAPWALLREIVGCLWGWDAGEVNRKHHHILGPPHTYNHNYLSKAFSRSGTVRGVCHGMSEEQRILGAKSKMPDDPWL